MEVRLNHAELRRLLQESFLAGHNQAKEDLGVIKPFISKAEAYRKYGRSVVDRWISEGLISLIKDGPDSSKIRIERSQIEQVAISSNRISYYNHHR